MQAEVDGQYEQVAPVSKVITQFTSWQLATAMVVPSGVPLYVADLPSLQESDCKI